MAASAVVALGCGIVAAVLGTRSERDESPSALAPSPDGIRPPDAHPIPGTRDASPRIDPAADAHLEDRSGKPPHDAPEEAPEEDAVGVEGIGEPGLHPALFARAARAPGMTGIQRSFAALAAAPEATRMAIASEVAHHLNDPAPELRISALRALDALLPADGSSSPAGATAATHAHPPILIAALDQALARGTRAERIAALRILRQRGVPELLPHLETLLSADDAGVIAKAAEISGLLGYQPVRALLQALLTSEHERVRADAAIALHRMGQQDALDAVAELAQDARDPGAALRAFRYLGQQPDARRIEIALRFLESEDVLRITSACNVLVDAGHTLSRDEMRHLLDHDDPAVLLHAWYVLAASGDAAADRSLWGVLDPGELWPLDERAATVRRLLNLHGSDAHEPLRAAIEKQPEDQRAYLDSVLQQGPTRSTSSQRAASTPPTGGDL